MTPAVTVTPAERLADTLHRLAYLIDRHSLPEPRELEIGTAGPGHIRLRLKDETGLRRWAASADADVVTSDHMTLACGVLGDMPLRMTCFRKALTG
jgi:hypothetical protein